MAFYGCIYLVTNLENGKKYVGQHSTTEHLTRWKAHLSRAKCGSKHLLHNSIRKYGEEAFKVERLCVCPVDSLTDLEGYYAEQYDSYMWDNGYNMVWCSKSPRLGLKNTPEAIEKCRQTQLVKKRTPEAIEKCRQTQLGKKHTPEACEKVRQANLGKKQTPEAIEKIRQAKLGKKHSPEHIEKNRQAGLGRKHTPEAIEKVRQARLAYWAKKRLEKISVPPVENVTTLPPATAHQSEDATRPAISLGQAGTGL